MAVTYSTNMPTSKTSVSQWMTVSNSECLLNYGGMKFLRSLYFDHRLPLKSVKFLGSMRKQTDKFGTWSFGGLT